MRKHSQFLDCEETLNWIFLSFIVVLVFFYPKCLLSSTLTPNPALTGRDIYFTEIEKKIILFKSTVY